MITDPQNDFEKLENALAVQLEAQTEFQNLRAPDGSPWAVITEDEGDVETMFQQMISTCGLAIVVQTPTGRTDAKTQNIPGPRFEPLICPVQVSESVIFNRDVGTKVRVQTAASVVRRSLHLFTPPGIDGCKAPLRLIEVMRDRDRHPDTGALVSSVVCIFHAVLNEQSKTIQ